MARFLDEEQETDVFRKLLVPGILMTFAYVAATDCPGLLFLLAHKAGLLQSPPFAIWALYLPSTAGMMLTGLIVIRAAGLTRAETGLSIPSDRSCLPTAVLLGAAAAVVTVACVYLPGLLFRLGEQPDPFHDFPRSSRAAPETWALAMTSAAWGTARAFLFFGAMQAYLARKSSAHVRLIAWEIPAAGIAVFLVVMLLNLVSWMSAPFFLLSFVTMTFLPAASWGVVMLASASWFERSRSLAAPALALGVYHGLAPVLHSVAISILT